MLSRRSLLRAVLSDVRLRNVTPLRCRWDVADSRPNSNTRTRWRPQPQGPIKNENIPYEYVQVIDEETGQTQSRARLRDVLASMDRKKYEAHLVSEDPTPIVKIFSQSALYHAKREQHAKLRAAKIEQKEVQMSWGVSPADLGHKLKKVRKEISKGARVDVVFAPKAKHPAPERGEMLKKMQDVVDELSDIAMEWGPRTLERRVAVIHLQRDPSKRIEGETTGKTTGKTTRDSGSDTEERGPTS